MSKVVVDEQHLMKMISKVEEQQNQLVELAQLYEQADEANKSSTEQLIQFQEQNQQQTQNLKQQQDKLVQVEELLKFRDQQITVLQRQLLKFTQSGLVPDQSSMIGLIPPSQPENIQNELQMLRDSLQFQGTTQVQPIQIEVEKQKSQEQIDKLNKKIEDLQYEINQNKFESKNDIPNQYVHKELETVIEGLKFDKQELSRKNEILNQEIGEISNIKDQYSQLQMQNIQLSNDVAEKDNDIMQFIQAISELQNEKSEMEIAMQMMGQQQQMMQNTNSNFNISVNQMIQTDVAMQNSMVMFNIDFDTMKNQIQQQCQQDTNELLTGLLDDLTNYTTKSVTKLNFRIVVKEIIDKQIQLDLQLTQFQSTKFEENQTTSELKIKNDHLESENEILIKQLEVEKANSNTLQFIQDDLNEKIKNLQEEIINNAQSLGQKDLQIENQNQKIIEQEQILLQAKSNLQRYSNVGESNQNLVENLTVISNENNSLKVELEMIKTAHQQLSEQIEIQKNINLQQQNDTQELKSLLDEKFSENETLKNQVSGKQKDQDNQSQQALDQLNGLTIEIKHLKTQLAEANELLKESNIDLIETKQQFSRSEALLSEKENQLQIERNNNQTHTTQISAQKDSLKTLNISIEKLRNEKEELLLKFTDQKVEKNVIETEKQNNESQFKEKITNLEKEIQILKSQNDDFNKVLNVKNQEITELEVELRKYVNQYNEKNLKVEDIQLQSENELHKLENQIIQQKQTISELEQKQIRLTSEVTFLSEEKQLLNNNVQQKDTQIASLQNQLFNQEKLIKDQQLDLEKAFNDQNRLKTHLEHTELEITRREESFLSQTELIKTKFEDYTQKQLEREITKKNQEISRLQNILDQKQGELDAVKQDFTFKVNELTQALNQIEVQNRKLIQQEQLTARIRQNSSEMKEQYENKFTNIKNENQRLIGQIQTSEMNYKLQETQRSANVREEYNKQIEELVHQLKDLQLENEKIKVKIQMENVEKDRHQQELNRNQTKINEIEKEFEKQIKASEKYRELYKKAYQVVEKMKEKERNQKSVIEGLEKRVDELARRQNSRYDNNNHGTTNYTPGAW